MPLNEYDQLLTTGKPAVGNEYDALLAEQHDANKVSLRQAVSAAVDADPERRARAIEYAERYNLPTSVVERNLDIIERQDKVERNDYDELLDKMPRAAEWMQESPDNAAVAVDDLDTLSTLEALTSAITTGYRHGRETNELGYHGYAVAGGVRDPSVFRRIEALERDLSAVPGGRGFSAQWVYPAAKFIGQFFDSGVRSLNTALGGSITGGTSAFIAGQAGPQALLPEEIVTVPAGAVAGFTAGLGAGYFKESYTIESGHAYLELSRVRGENGEQIDEETKRAGSVFVGMVNGTLELLGVSAIAAPVKQAFKKWFSDSAKDALVKPTMRAAVKEFGKNYAKAIAGEVTTEVLQETNNIFVEEVAKLATEGDFEMLSNSPEEREAAIARLIETASETFRGMALVGLPGASINLATDVRNVSRARENERFFQALGESATNSKLRERLPAKLAEVVERMTKDGPVENVYVPIEAWQTYFQGVAVDPRAVAVEILGSADAYDVAIQTGEDLKIPMGRYAAKVAGTDHHKGLTPDLRLHPDEMTAREAEAFTESLKAESQQTEAGEDTSAPSIRDDVVGQLVGLGFERGTAEAYADLYESTFRTLGKRAGVDPMALYRRYGLSIERPAPDALRKGDTDALDILIDRLRKGDIPKDRDIYGPSLVDFLREGGGLQDQGGELSARDVQKAVRGLVKETGRTLDDAAEQAAEAGYIDERDPNKLLEALDVELRGERVSARGRVNTQLLDIATAIEQLEEYLGQRGVNLSEADNKAIKELLRAPNDETVTSELFQTAALTLDEFLTQTQEQRRSKVTEAGLVVGMKTTDGKVIAGMPREGHVHLLMKYPEESVEAEFGFVDRTGKFYTRAQAMEQFRVVDSAQLGGRELFQSVGDNEDGYQADIFGDPLPDKTRPRKRAAKTRDVQPVAVVLKTEDETPGVFAVETSVVTERSRDLPLAKATTPEEVAQALAFLSNYAVEHFDALLTDKNGKPLAIVGSFKGAISGVAVYAATIAQEAFRIKGAANIWFAHNHPSGNSTLSRQDEVMNRRITEVFNGSGITPRGLFAIAGSGDVREFTYQDTSGDMITGTIKRPGKTAVRVPITERVLTKDERLGAAIESPRDAMDIVANTAQGQPGVLLLDNRHKPVAFVPLDPNESSKFRTDGRMDRMYRALSKANAAAALIANPNESFSDQQLENIAGLFTTQEVRVLDAIDYTFEEGKTPTNMQSRSERGREPSGQTFMQGRTDDKRGSIQIGGDRQIRINLFERANLSTFLHESGHFYLEVLADLAEAPNAPADLREDFDTILKWLGAKSRAEITTDMHEKFARGFEAYLMEGNAPSAGLRSTFAKFKTWLIAIYRSLVRLNVKLNDDVRDVMDRLIATEEEIAAAEEQGQVTPLFNDAAAAGMTDAEFKAYQETIEKASIAARDKLGLQLMREHRRAQEQWWKDARAKVRAEVASEIHQQPIYQASALLKDGTLPDGSKLPEGVRAFKLDRDAIVNAYGKEFAKRFPREMFAKENGVHPDQAAETFGFPSGEQLLLALVNLRPQDDLIDAETDARMREQYGDLRFDGTALANAAEQAVEGPERAKVIAAELKALRKKAREVRPFVRAAEREQQDKQREGLSTLRGTQIPIDQIQGMAAGLIAQKRVRDLNPNLFLVAIRRSARQAVEAAAKGAFDVAAAAKQRELMNLELYRAAIAAREEMDDVAEYMRKFGKSSTRQRLARAGGDYLEQIDGLLDRFEFKRVTGTQLERRQALAEWIRQKEASGESLGEEIGISEELRNEAFRINYRELSVEQMRGLRDAVKQIEHFASIKNKLLAAKVQRERDEARAELLESLEKNLKDRGPPPFTKAGLTKVQALGARARAVDASLLKVETLIDWMDGGDITGPWHRYLWDGASDAQAAELDYSKRITKRVTDAVMNIPKEIRARMLERVQIDGIDRVMTRKDIIGVALNVGNQSNYDKLLKGMGWQPEQVEQMLDRLTKAEWDFVQSIWDTLESLWPDIAKLQKELTGVEPEKVEIRQVATKFGAYAGGYYPVIYDPLASEHGQLQLASRVGNLVDDTYTRATTPKGHTKKRIEGFARPFNLDIDELPGHTAGVIKDLTHRKWLLDVNWLVHDREIRAALRQHLGDEYVGLFPDWVRAVANDRNFASMRSLNIWRRGFEHLRYNVMIASMGFKAATMMSQLAGVGPAIEVVGGAEKDGRKYFSRAFAQVARRPRAVYELATGLSGEMRHRLDTRDRDMRDKLRLLQGRKDWLADFQQFALRGIAWADMMVSLPTWLAGYQKALDQGRSQEDAVHAGDRAVRLSQGAGGAKDLASVMSRNDTLMRILTMFYTPFNALYNRLRDVGHSVHGIGDAPQAALRLWWVWLVPAVVGELLAGRSPDGDDEDDFDWWARQVLLYPTLAIPFVRDVAAGSFGEFGYQLSPIAQVGNSVARTVKTAGKVLEGDAELEDLAARALKTTGYLLGLPTGQLEITGGYLYDLAIGDADPEDLGEFMHDMLYRRREE